MSKYTLSTLLLSTIILMAIYDFYKRENSIIKTTIYVPVYNNSSKAPNPTNKETLKKLFNITYPVNTSDAYEIYNKVIQPLHSQWTKILASEGIDGGEGHSGLYTQQTVFYIQAVLDMIQYHKKNIMVCEIGYNMGHSALTYLFSDFIGRIQYLAFSYPINNHQLILKLMKDTFKLSDQLTVLWGDSTEYLPYYISAKNHANKHKCDIVIVDGGHIAPVPQIDINNMRFLAKISKHLLIVDDCGCQRNWCNDPTNAWKASVQSELINQTNCISQSLMGFCWGQYNFAI